VDLIGKFANPRLPVSLQIVIDLANQLAAVRVGDRQPRQELILLLRQRQPRQF
jgi:hypothetical protein